PLLGRRPRRGPDPDAVPQAAARLAPLSPAGPPRDVHLPRRDEPVDRPLPGGAPAPAALLARPGADERPGTRRCGHRRDARAARRGRRGEAPAARRPRAPDRAAPARVRTRGLPGAAL